MAKLKKIGMAAGTFSVALGIGFVMQNGDALASRFGDGAEPSPARFVAESDPIPAVQAGAVTNDVLTEETLIEPAIAVESDITQSTNVADGPQLEEPDLIETVSVSLPDEARLVKTPEAPVQMASVDPETMPAIEDGVVTDAQLATLECVPEITATAAPAATIAVVVEAPCQGDTAFTVHHQGMMFTEKTDAAGGATFTVPALAQTAVIIAAFGNGDGAVATAVVPDFDAYDRAVLQWQGEGDIMLSAYESGAAFGEDGHIHSANPGDMARLEASEGGYLMTLGGAHEENALMAEVYTYPSGTMVSGSWSDVHLVAEAEVTAGNCGNEFSAQSIQVSMGGAVSALDLTMIMPDCDAVGDFLILQNMFEDLTLASR